MPSVISHPPHSTTLLNSMRSVGYTLESAVADIIDNSITAGSTCVSVLYDKADNLYLPWLAICDNGSGMTREKLLQSMRFGCREQEQLAEMPNPRDLGRYGLGLKTASFSQCRKLTVFSWKNGEGHAFCWDLEQVGENWNIQELRGSLPESHDILKKILQELSQRKQKPFTPTEHGTIVLWEHMDRDNLQKETIDKAMGEVWGHLSLVFHRFMKKEDEAQPVRFDMNNREIPPHDPFSIPDSRKLPGDRFWSTDSKHTMHFYQPYIVPTDESESFAEGQGFYVYRNKRLIRWATWFKLVAKEPALQRLRIQLDVTSEHDMDWQVDVRKSQVTPPADVKNWLRELLPEACRTARRAYYSRIQVDMVNSPNVRNDPEEPLWTATESEQGFHYSLIPDHTLLVRLKKELSEEGQKLLCLYLRNAAATFPYQHYEHTLRQKLEKIAIAQPLSAENKEREEQLRMLGLDEEDIIALLRSQRELK